MLPSGKTITPACSDDRSGFGSLVFAPFAGFTVFAGAAGGAAAGAGASFGGSAKGSKSTGFGAAAFGAAVGAGVSVSAKGSKSTGIGSAITSPLQTAIPSNHLRDWDWEYSIYSLAATI